MANEKKIPRKIWVQWYGEEGPEDGILDATMDEAVTWCADKINEHDVAYVTEESAVLAQLRNHKQGFLEGVKAASEIVTTELAKLA